MSGQNGDVQTTRSDPVLQLMGWRAEPMLRKRLKWYIVEGVFEAGCLVIAMHCSKAFMAPGGDTVASICMLPLFVVLVKLAWCLRLAAVYYRARGRDVAVVLQHLGAVHSRTCWSCSAAALTCLTCVSMVLYAILFLLLTAQGAQTRGGELVAKILIGMFAFFVGVNWLVWHDVVNSKTADCHDNPATVRTLKMLWRMHRGKALRLHRYKDLALRQTLPTACVVCLEDFRDRDFVEQLPCGHTFHPTCAHRWIVADNRCPFRCSLEACSAGGLPEARARAWPAAGDAVIAAAVEGDLEVIDLESSDVDLEAAGVR